MKATYKISSDKKTLEIRTAGSVKFYKDGRGYSAARAKRIVAQLKADSKLKGAAMKAAMKGLKDGCCHWYLWIITDDNRKMLAGSGRSWGCPSALAVSDVPGIRCSYINLD